MQDALARRQWDRYDTGEETRDVLEVRCAWAHHAQAFCPCSACFSRWCLTYLLCNRMVCAERTWRCALPEPVVEVCLSRAQRCSHILPRTQARLGREVTREDVEISMQVCCVWVSQHVTLCHASECRLGRCAACASQAR